MNSKMISKGQWDGVGHFDADQSGFQYRFIIDNGKFLIIRLEIINGSFINSPYSNKNHPIIARGFLAFIVKLLYFGDHIVAIDNFNSYYNYCKECYQEIEKEFYSIDRDLDKEFYKSHIAIENEYLNANKPFYDIDYKEYSDLKTNAERHNKDYLKWLISLNNLKSSQRYSYEWQNKPDEELLELYNLLSNKYKLIAPDTTYEQFKPIFTKHPIESIIPIRWHDDNVSELLYFIQRLEQSDQVKHTKNADYQKMTACFIKPDGNPFQAAFKNLKTNIIINLSPDKQRPIDELISQF
ncbi:MAG: hypothetical protein AB9834_01260 [Lentimicrobium sp.]